MISERPWKVVDFIVAQFLGPDLDHRNSHHNVILSANDEDIVAQHLTKEDADFIVRAVNERKVVGKYER